MLTRIGQIHRVVGWRAWGWLGVSLFFSLAFSGIEVLFAYFLAHLLYLLQVNVSDPALPFYVPVFFQTREGSIPFLLILGLGRTTMRVLANQSVVLFGEIVHSRLRFIFFEEIYDRRAPRIVQSDINTLLGEIFPKSAGFMTAAGNLLASSVQTCFFFAALLVKSPVKAVAGLAALMILGPAVRLSYRYVRGLSHQVIEHFAEVQRSIVRVTRNWVLIRLLRTEAMELARLRHASIDTTQKSLRIELVNSISVGVPEVAGIAVIATLIVLQYGPDRQSAGAFVAFLYLFMRFVQSLVQAGTQMGSLQATYPSFQRSADFFSKVPDNDLKTAVSTLRSLSLFGRSHSRPFADKEFRSSGADLIHFPPAIMFRNVSFWYGEGSTIIKNLSFEVPAGSAFGIVGPSGVGKSTILALFMGVEVPDQGQIRFVAGGSEFEPVNHRLTIGYVGPEPFLVAGSVADNLLYGSVATASDAALLAALRKAGFSESDAELSALLNSQLTESGEGLSTGQKQRLCLARALLASPALLILDEVSANLDMSTERKIAKTVGDLRGESTIIIASHREGMLTPCDRILDLTSSQLKVQS